MDAGMGWFSPDRGYEVTGGPSGACMSAQQCTFGVGPGSLRSDKDFFLIPHFGWKRSLGENAAIGVAVYGNGGMNTRYLGGSATFGGGAGTEQLNDPAIWRNGCRQILHGTPPASSVADTSLTRR